MLCNHKYHPQPEFFIIPNGNFEHIKQLTPYSTLLLPIVTTIFLSVSMNLPILGPFFKGNHTVFVLLYQAYFTQHNVFKVRSCCSICQLHSFLMSNHIPLYTCVCVYMCVYICIYILYNVICVLHFIYPFFCSWTFELCPHFGNCK